MWPTSKRRDNYYFPTIRMRASRRRVFVVFRFVGIDNSVGAIERKNLPRTNVINSSYEIN